MNLDFQRIAVPLKNNAYEIVIGNNILNNIGEELLKAGFKRGLKILVVSNPDVANHYSMNLISRLKESGYKTRLLVLEAGESKKDIRSIEMIYNAAFSENLERGSLMIALGGGVIGDMTGFAAATWLRGISVIQVPTTLLAMVDAAIGGKTGVNHPGGKNLIGAFHQPSLVLIDPLTLLTLPKREFSAGMAEIIKYGVIGDIELFQMLEKELILDYNSLTNKTTLSDIIKRSAYTKAQIVLSDEKESGLRAILNYGHTFGHVIETLCGYGTWLHGEAVSIGMMAVGQLAVHRNLWSKEDLERQKDLLVKSNLPIKWPQLDKQSVLKTLKGDKKVKDGNIRFILPSEIGKVEIYSDIEETEILKCLDNIN